MANQAPSVIRTVKYTFDNVFGDNTPGTAANARERSTYSAEEVERIRGENFAAGKADAEAMAAALKADAMTNVGAGVARLLRSVGEIETALRADCVELALAIARKLAQTALNAFPLREVEEVVADCLHKLHREPRLVVRVPPQMTEALQAEIHGLADRHGFAGRIVVLGEPSLSGADCRVEWADGGLEREFDTNFAAIDEAVARWRIAIETESKS